MKKTLGLILALFLLIPSLGFAIDMQNLKIGGEIWVRGYDLENFWSNDESKNFDDWNAFRLRGSLFTSMDVGDNVSGYIRITDQNYGEGVTYSPKMAGAGTDKWEEDNKSNKVFLENAYIDAKSMFGGPVDVRFGRQNLIYGSGFVVLDGQSQFASTSIYFDGVKLTWNIVENLTLDSFYMKDQENERANNPDDDITLSGLYFTSKKTPVIGGQAEVYVMNREDESSCKDIDMYGVRLSNKYDFGLDYSAEVALQAGDAYNGEDQEALGAKLDLGYTFPIDIKPRIFAQYALMSGDDESTEEYEGWDVFYGGWPQFGDLLAWKFVNLPVGPGGAQVNNNVNYDPNFGKSSSVVGEAIYENLSILTFGLGCKIMDKVSPKVSYSIIKLDETYAARTNDDDFGDYFQASIGYEYSKALAFNVYFATIDPGDAFLGQDTATEFYWETSLKF
ncbi:MAG: alginate export family protein [Proteobacteria bacterium]|nr:alginate export family protein [Pseudomonadota bacterium]MBU4469315.1 alginate export family protein [Pseudomonadota bacterium]MCG2750794.1 alginate export family protein [Desulfobacteraceae bacterium]